MRYLIALAIVVGAGRALAAEGTAPFYLERNKLVFSANIEDKGPFLFVLDINLPQSVLDASLAERLGLVVAPESGLVSLENVRLGNLPAMPLSFATADLSSFKKMLGVQISGMFSGREFGKKLELDFARKQAVFSDADDNPDIDKSKFIKMEDPGETGIIVTAVIDDAHICRFILDTTLGATVAVPARLLSEWGISMQKAAKLDEPPVAATHPVGHGQVRLKSVRLGNWEMTEPVCAVAREEEAPAIGLGFLKNFDVTVWFAAGQIELESTKKTIKEEPVSGYGLMPAEFSGSYWTIWVAQNSPAAREGLVSGGILVAINGKDAKNLSYAAATALMIPGEDGKLTVSVQQGDDTHTVSLAPEKLL